MAHIDRFFLFFLAFAISVSYWPPGLFKGSPCHRSDNVNIVCEICKFKFVTNISETPVVSWETLIVSYNFV